MTNPYTHLPDDTDLLAFFESEPLESCPNDGYLCYAYSVPTSPVTLLFSVNVHEKSVQTALLLDDKEISVVSAERAEQVHIADDTLQVAFADTSGLEIRLRPAIHVRHWVLDEDE